MASLHDFLGWLERDLSRFSQLQDHFTIKHQTPLSGRIHFFTDTNHYTLIATEGDPGHLSCYSESRKPRAGETWVRGNDIADGPLTEQMWHTVLGLIVSYELVRIRHKHQQERLHVAK